MSNQVMEVVEKRLAEVKAAPLAFKAGAVEKFTDSLLSLVRDQQNRIEQLERKINGS